MSDPADFPARVGRQLAERRDDLDLTQAMLAQHIGVTTNSISAVERGVNTISRKNRPLWEEALRLQPGTIGRAYRDGTDLQPVGLFAEGEITADDVQAKAATTEGAREIAEALERYRRRIGTLPEDADAERKDTA